MFDFRYRVYVIKGDNLEWCDMFVDLMIYFVFFKK